MPVLVGVDLLCQSREEKYPGELKFPSLWMKNLHGGALINLNMCSFPASPSSSVEEIAHVLSKCRNVKRDLSQALHLHTRLCHQGLENQALGNRLVRLFVESDGLAYAHQVFEKLEHRDGSSWSWLISGYVGKGHYFHGFSLFRDLQRRRDPTLKLNPQTFVALLKACIATKDSQMGSSLHAELCRQDLLDSDAFLAATLVDLYSRCGCLAKAEEVFYSLHHRDVVVWTVLLAGHVEHGYDEEAIACVQAMQSEDVSPDAFTFVCGLRACSGLGSIEAGQGMYAQIVVKGLETELLVANTLIDMYVKLGSITTARWIFDRIRDRSVVSWNILLGGYLDGECGEKAMDFYGQMQSEGVSGDAITFVCVLRACGAIGSMTDAYETHVAIVEKGLEHASLVGNTLVDFYAKSGHLADLKQVFERLPSKDSVSWSAFLSGLASNGCGQEAFSVLESMRVEGVSLNSVTSICILKSCVSVGADIEGREVHSSIITKGLESDLMVSNALVDMYSKFGWMAVAQKVFDGIEKRDVVTWNALISGYVEQDCGEKVVGCIDDMEREGISADAFTLDSCLKACGSVGAIDNGHEVHAAIVKKGLDDEHFIRTTLVDTQAKCGLFAEAQHLFDRLPEKDIIAWTALLAGYSLLGEIDAVFALLESMVSEGIMPNLVTFLSILNACSHGGLVHEAEGYFEAIVRIYGFVPTQEHYTCVVDALGRAGQIEKAMVMMREIPSHPGVVAWHAVLGACKKWGHVDRGKDAFEEVLWLDGTVGSTYVCMSNIYADVVEDDMMATTNRR
jgi:pentatricopeptide repeat protein